MSISAKDVKALSDQTGAGTMDCKKALTESGGDLQKAVEYLRKKGHKLSEKRADRVANEGVVIALTSGNRNNGVVLRLALSKILIIPVNEDQFKIYIMQMLLRNSISVIVKFVSGIVVFKDIAPIQFTSICRIS